MKFDAVVIGGGHAGVEAARALSARLKNVALITLDKNKIGAMSCNPAIGGVAKSHLVYEVDALGGWMGKAADHSGIQARRLNLNKGPAVRSTRIQCDKQRYQSLMSDWMSRRAGIHIIEGEAFQVLTNANKDVSGVRLKSGEVLETKVAVVTSGTFMGGIMFCGEVRQKGGRFGDSASEGLSASIQNLGHSIKRLKTGTPARLKASTIDFSKWEKQWGDPERRTFSWDRSLNKLPQLACYFGHTNERTHEVIRANFDKSPLFSGDISGVGPRYCPSVEDKIRRFTERARHQIFLEPEGLDTDSIYPNGMSTSLPESVQLEFFRTIDGLEKVEFLRPGYAVEYDVFDPKELTCGFQSKFSKGLFLAGQINRTSGYEEAAAQGLWAGLQAARYFLGEDEIRPDRSRSYMETLVDDLVTKGSEEPYRMFTSRSEFRLLLREDNAHERMFELGKSNGLLTDEQCRWYESMVRETEESLKVFREARIRLDANRVISVFDYLKRPEVTWEGLDLPFEHQPDELVLEKIEIEAKYSGYLKKQNEELLEYKNIQNWRLDQGFNYSQIPTLSKEVLEKLSLHRPASVAELASISGITPSAVIAIGRAAGVVSRETNS
ncbi:MAG: tRNA uridine-5-carboxymethylaminomethyl(34) synthesis enzyme MnmG [Bdellovibrionales bacterium]|nr:tRNA uridine-5-carboxymethylaminomethyl(34) synthesis enzyme MnmG [Bdellovibrionales bacterium]